MSSQFAPDKVERWVTKAKHGNVKAFGRLYECFVDSIFRYIVVRIRSVEDSQDLTAEVFKKAWEYLERYRHQNFRAFLYTIAHNLIVDWVRKKQKEVKVPLERISDPKENLETKLESDEEIKRLYLAIEELPDSYKQVIILRFLEELSINETAAVLNKTSLSVRVTQFKAVRKLKQILHD